MKEEGSMIVARSLVEIKYTLNCHPTTRVRYGYLKMLTMVTPCRHINV